MQKLRVAAALLLGTLVLSASHGMSGAQPRPPTPANELAESDVWAVFFYLFAFSEPVRSEEEARKHSRRQQRTAEAYVRALNGLRLGNGDLFARGRAELERMAADTHRTFSDLSNARFAQNLLATLPKKYVAGFALLQDDGTPATDPDAFVRHQLVRASNLAHAGGDGGGGAD